jgi:hypothetical protein
VPRSARASLLAGYNAAATIVEASEAAGMENGPCRPATELGEEAGRAGTAGGPCQPGIVAPELGEDVLASRLTAHAAAASSLSSSQHLDAR